MRAAERARLWMVVVAAVGVALSLYALHVELAKEEDHDYQAMCDISPAISCSKVFTSKYGRGFGLVGPLLGEDHILNQPNSIFGLVFYPAVIVMGEIRSIRMAQAQCAVIASSNLMSLYLGYLLYFVLHDFCVVCVSTYIVNLALTLLAFHRLAALRHSSRDKPKTN